MKTAGIFFLGAVVGVLVGVALVKSSKGDAPCCDKLKRAVDAKAGGTGLVGGALDALGLTGHLPGILDAVGA